MKKKIIYICSIIGALFVGVIGTVLVYKLVPNKNTTEYIEKTVSSVNITEKDTLKTAIDKIYDAVVVIENYSNNTLKGTGTGFVYKKDDEYGYIITNQHVIEGGTLIKAIFTNGDTVEAKVLGSDIYADIAVLSVSADSVIQVAEIGASESLEVGDTLFTVGTPVGMAYMGTVTKGILSGKDRTVSVSLSTGGKYMMNVLQTDAAINPGNSGGPLCNINGEVIGVNSMKLVQEKIEGMGFAIPVEIVMTAVEQLEKGEQIKRPMIGATLIDANNTYSLYRNGIVLNESFDAGVVIYAIESNYPASVAGMQKNDVILEIDGVKIKDMSHFRFVLYQYNIGDQIKVKYYRDGNIKEATLVLDKSVEDDD